VQAVNDAPSGTDNTVSTSEDVPYVFAVADFDLNDPLDVPATVFNAVKIVALPSTGNLLLNGIPITANDFISKADLDAGKFRFFPPLNEFGNALGTFTFQVQDDGGLSNGGNDIDLTPNQITINVLAVGDTPRVTNSTTVENTLSGPIVINRHSADGAEVMGCSLIPSTS